MIIYPMIAKVALSIGDGTAESPHVVKTRYGLKNDPYLVEVHASLIRYLTNVLKFVSSALVFLQSVSLVIACKLFSKCKVKLYVRKRTLGFFLTVFAPWL